MRAVKAEYANGRIELPPDLPAHEPCEVTVLFPEGGDRRAEAGRERFLRAAGAWSHMDTEDLKKRIYEARKISLRPRPNLRSAI